MSARGKDTGVLTREKVQQNIYSFKSNSSSSFIGEARRNYFNGVDIPNYYARKKRGDLLPHTPFNKATWEYNHVAGNYYSRHTGSGNTTTRTNYMGPGISGQSYRVFDFHNNNCDLARVPASSDVGYLIQQAASRIYSQGWDALTFAGELPSLRRQFKGVAGRMVKLAKDFNRKDLYRAWLEGRYGWRTLAYDVRDLNDAINDYDASREIYTERVGYSFSEVSNDTASSSNNDFDFSFTETTTRNYSVRGAVAGRLKPARFQVDPLKTGWELVPYSFVVDWVYGVGVALDTLRFLSASSEHTASKGVLCSWNRTSTVTGTPKTGFTGYANVTYEGEGETEWRIPTSVDYNPRLTGRLLTPDISLDIQALSRVRTRLR